MAHAWSAPPPPLPPVASTLLRRSQSSPPAPPASHQRPHLRGCLLHKARGWHRVAAVGHLRQQAGEAQQQCVLQARGAREGLRVRSWPALSGRAGPCVMRRGACCARVGRHAQACMTAAAAAACTGTRHGPGTTFGGGHTVPGTHTGARLLSCRARTPCRLLSCRTHTHTHAAHATASEAGARVMTRVLCSAGAHVMTWASCRGAHAVTWCSCRGAHVMTWCSCRGAHAVTWCSCRGAHVMTWCCCAHPGCLSHAHGQMHM